MSSDTLERDELLDEVLEDERAAAVQKFRELEEAASDTAERADV